MANSLWVLDGDNLDDVGYEAGYKATRRKIEDPSEQINLSQVSAPAQPDYTRLYGALSPDSQKLIANQLLDIERADMAAKQKFMNLNLNSGKQDDDDDGLGRAIGQAMIALLPIAGGYLLGGNRLAASGAGIGAAASQNFEDVLKHNENMEAKKKAIEEKRLAAELEANAADKKALLGYAIDQQERSEDRGFRIQDREDQQRHSFALQANQQAFARSQAEKEGAGALATPEELESWANIWETQNQDPARAAILRNVAAEVREGKRKVPSSQMYLYAPNKPMDVSDKLQDAASKSEIGAMTALKAINDIKKLSGKSWADLAVGQKIPMTDASIYTKKLTGIALGLASADLAGTVTQLDVQAYLDQYATPEAIASGEGFRELRAMAARSLYMSIKRLEAEAQQSRTGADATRQLNQYMKNVAPIMQELGLSKDNLHAIATHTDIEDVEKQNRVRDIKSFFGLSN